MAGTLTIALLLLPLVIVSSPQAPWPSGHDLAPLHHAELGDADGAADGSEATSAPKIVITDVSLERGKEEGFSKLMTRVTVKGTVDLPDHAQLMIRLAETTYRIPFLRGRGAVKDGKFEIGMGPYERPLFPGTYEVGVVFFPERQPRKAGEAVLRRSSAKTAKRWTFEGEKAAAARLKSLERTRATLKTLETLADQIVVWTARYRVMDKAKKLPAEIKLRSKQEEALGTWTITYDRTREAHDDRLDEYLILPTPRTEQEIIKLINLLMDFQYECKARITGDKEFLVERSLELFGRLRIRTRNAFRFEEILLAPEPATAMRTEVLRLIAALKDKATMALPERAKLIAALDAGKDPRAGDRRRLALYRQLISWRQLRDDFVQERKQSPDAWLATTNRWLHTFRATPRVLADTPAGDALAARLALATLLEISKASVAAKKFDALEAPEVGALDPLADGMVERLDLREVHARDLRLQWTRIGDLAKELAAKTGKIAKMERPSRRDWEDFVTPWGTDILRLMEAQLPGVGPLKGDKARLAVYAKTREEIRDVLMDLSRHRISVEVALMMSRPHDAKAALAVIPQLEAMHAAARKRVGGK